ncbi:Uncharacterized protein Fot_32262 [Forsythia ovata]|uniref:Uncharacterized protein n=1 Tax=Forsythia ovata TaxID=205694 RepID=A0ABD1T7F1_9LAMI
MLNAVDPDYVESIEIVLLHFLTMFYISWWQIVESFTAHYVFALGVAWFLSCANWVLQNRKFRHDHVEAALLVFGNLAENCNTKVFPRPSQARFEENCFIEENFEIKVLRAPEL